MQRDIKEGDIFRWHYKDAGKHGSYPYHCKSCIAYARNGRLVDTFWSYGDCSTTFAYDDDRIELTFIANQDDLIPAERWKGEYYDDSDIVDLSHANSSHGNYYIRKGAQKSRTKILAVLMRKIEKHERDASYSSREANRLRQVMEQVENATSLDGVHI